MSDPVAVREALRALLTAWAVAEVRGDQARVLPVPDFGALDARLSAADPTWSLSWKVESVSPPMVRAALGLGGALREGLSGGHTFDDARKLALADAFRFYGVASTGEAPWVEYDPDDGPNVSELMTELISGPGSDEPGSAPRPGQVRPLPPHVPLDPQLSKARAHIDTLMEQLRDGGKGKEAMKLLLRGYGETVEESRAIYKELQALQRQGT